MRGMELLENMELADPAYVEAADAPPKRRGRRKWAVLAACLALLIAADISLLLSGPQIPLSANSVGVTARYTDHPAYTGSSDLLLYLTEEELFTEFDTAIFKGTVTDIDNIELDFRGSKSYHAIAKIQIEEVYRGDCQAGETATVLLPCPVGTDLSVEDTGIVSQMEVGMTGIFMPVIYTEDSIWQENGATLIKKDLADYGFADGLRYAFLEKGGSLIFARSAYKSISHASTLDEIREYVIRMTESTKSVQ